MTKMGRPPGPPTKQVRTTLAANKIVNGLAKKMKITMVQASHLLIRLGEQYLREEGLYEGITKNHD